jgi:chitinase
VFCGIANNPCDTSGNRCRCELDEFPMAALLESNQVHQALRMVNGNENGRQGADFNAFISASFMPCSSLLDSAPPVTWKIGTIPVGDPRAGAIGIIPKYGVSVSSHARLIRVRQ